MPRPDEIPDFPLTLPQADTNQVLPVGGGYRLLKRLGAGAFGEVWLAEAPGGVKVAVKIISRSLKKDQAGREHDALQHVKELRHPFLLSLQAYFSLPDQLVIVMELADGSLRGRLDELQQAGQRRLEPLELLRYFREAAEALDYLHEHNVQHRDIKPDNILLLGKHVKVADFGLARLLEKASLQTATQIGTPAYMAPEIWSEKLSAQSDQYSLAVSYAELRLGRFPFEYQNLPQLMYAHLNLQPNLAHLGREEQATLLRALAKEPNDRFPACGAFIQALAQAMMKDGQAATRSRKDGANSKSPGSRPAADGTTGTAPRSRTPPSRRRPSNQETAAGLDTFPPAQDPGRRNRLAAAYARRPWLLGLFVAVPLLVIICVLAWALSGRGRVLGLGSQPYVNSVGMELIAIAAGSFTMGSTTGADDEKPPHLVTLRQFRLAATKTTQGQFEKVMGRNPSCFSAVGAGNAKVAGQDTTDFPVENVSFYDAVEFCIRLSEQEKLRPWYRLSGIERDGSAIKSATLEYWSDGSGYRLPSEAEWEYCARAGSTSKYCFGDDEGRLGEYAWFHGNSGGMTHPVRQKKANDWGLFDMHGLAWEWCEDVHHTSYDGAPADGTAWRIGGGQSLQVRRGGSWNFSEARCRSSFRDRVAPGLRDYGGGFRVVLAPP